MIVLRHQPQRSNPHGLFGNGDSPYAAFSRKVSNAAEHGAAAIVFCNDDDELHRSVTSLQPAHANGHRRFGQGKRRVPQDRTSVARPDRRARQRRRAAGRPNREPCQNGRASKSIRCWASNAPARATIRTACPCCSAVAHPIDTMIKAATGPDLAAIEQQIDADRQARSRASLPAGESPAKPTSSAPKRRPETCSPNWKATARTPTKRSSSAPITIISATADSARSPRRPAM